MQHNIEQRACQKHSACVTYFVAIPALISCRGPKAREVRRPGKSSAMVLHESVEKHARYWMYMVRKHLNSTGIACDAEKTQAINCPRFLLLF